jgi:Holliday junction DNA helicase RuvA
MPVARVRGVVEEKGDDWLIVTVGGLGLSLSVPATTAGALEEGAPAALFTHLLVREDALTLFGFATRDDLGLFEQLISVSGVGPRVALGVLSAMDSAQAAAAIVSGRADALRRVPGVGQKTADRIVLELRDKVRPPEGDTAPKEPPAAKADADVLAALMALGYSQAEAAGAAETLDDGADAMPLEDRIRAALRAFARV